jgi:hypothetical protein
VPFASASVAMTAKPVKPMPFSSSVQALDGVVKLS